MTKEEAVKLFVERDFNNIPLSLVEKAYKEEGLYEKILQPVQPEPSDFELDSEEEPQFLDEKSRWVDFTDEMSLAVATSNYDDALKEHNEAHERWEQYQTAYEEWEQKCEDYYPMWGTLFEANDSFIAQRILNNLKEVQDIGFIVIDDFDELSVCLGVAGCGYDFYSHHWQPLYDLLGLHWHKEEDSEE